MGSYDLKNEINKAIKLRKKIYMAYFGGSSPGKKRNITPLNILNEKNNSFIVEAFCHTRKEERYFSSQKIKLINADDIADIKDSFHFFSNAIYSLFKSPEKIKEEVRKTKNKNRKQDKEKNNKETISTFQARGKKIHISSSRYKERKEKIIDLSLSGKGPTEIANILGLPVKRVEKIKASLKKQGVSLPNLNQLGQKHRKRNKRGLFLKAKKENIKRDNNNESMFHDLICDQEGNINSYKQNVVNQYINEVRDTNEIFDRLEDINEIEKLSMQSIGPTKISKQLNLSPKIVKTTKARLRKSGVVFPKLHETIDEKLKRLGDDILLFKKQNASNNKITKTLGISGTDLKIIIAKMQKNGVYIPNYFEGDGSLSEEEINYRTKVINELRSEGHSYKSIAKKIGLSEIIIIRHKQRYID